MPDQPLIAVVDDDEPVREALSSLIRSLGHSVVVFASAADILRYRDRGRVACLISDFQMPGMNGLELYDELKRLGESIPTILITAYPSGSGRQRALESGVLCYLTKPFLEEDLLACLRQALQQGGGPL